MAALLPSTPHGDLTHAWQWHTQCVHHSPAGIFWQRYSSLLSVTFSFARWGHFSTIYVTYPHRALSLTTASLSQQRHIPAGLFAHKDAHISPLTCFPPLLTFPLPIPIKGPKSRGHILHMKQHAKRTTSNRATIHKNNEHVTQVTAHNNTSSKNQRCPITMQHKHRPITQP